MKFALGSVRHRFRGLLTLNEVSVEDDGLSSLRSVRSFPFSERSVGTRCRRLFICSSSLYFRGNSCNARITVSRRTVYVSTFVRVLLGRLLNALRLPIAIRDGRLSSQVVLRRLVRAAVTLGSEEDVFRTHGLGSNAFSIRFPSGGTNCFPAHFCVVTASKDYVVKYLCLSIRRGGQSVHAVDSLSNEYCVVRIVEDRRSWVCLPNCRAICLTDLTLPIVLYDDGRRVRVLVLVLHRSRLVVRLLTPGSTTALQRAGRRLLLNT